MPRRAHNVRRPIPAAARAVRCSRAQVALLRRIVAEGVVQYVGATIHCLRACEEAGLVRRNPEAREWDLGGLRVGLTERGVAALEKWGPRFPVVGG